jgi:hypothetical protein
MLAGGFVAGAAGCDGDPGRVEEFGAFIRLKDADDDAVGDAGDKGIDGVRVIGEERHGLAPGEADAVEGFRGVIVAGVVSFAGAVIRVKAALDGGFRCGHGWFLSWK